MRHIIDRKADFLRHYREWDTAGHKFLVRAVDRRVLFNGMEMKLSEIRREVDRQGGFQVAGKPNVLDRLRHQRFWQDCVHCWP